MLNLLSENNWSMVSALLVAAVVFFIVATFSRKETMKHWNIRTAILFLMGLLLCFSAVFRDGYIESLMGRNGMFALDSFPILLASLIGGLILFLAVVALFCKKQTRHRSIFFIMSSLIMVKIVTIELSRALM